jgi:hypothetical protein
LNYFPFLVHSLWGCFQVSQQIYLFIYLFGYLFYFILAFWVSRCPGGFQTGPHTKIYTHGRSQRPCTHGSDDGAQGGWRGTMGHGMTNAMSAKLHVERNKRPELWPLVTTSHFASSSSLPLLRLSLARALLPSVADFFPHCFFFLGLLSSTLCCDQNATSVSLIVFISTSKQANKE